MSSTPSGSNTDRIDVNDKGACESWAHRLNVTHEKLREAVGAVGDDPQRVEKHLRELGEQQKDGRGST